MDFYARYSSLDVKPRKDVPIRGFYKLKFNIKPLFIPQNRQILAQNTLDLVSFRLKMLNDGGAQE